MNQLVSKSFIEASEAERAVANLLSVGYSREEITIAVNDRQRRSYMGDTARHQGRQDGDTGTDGDRDQTGRGAMKSIVSKSARVANAAPIDREDELDPALVLGGPLASGIPGGESQPIDARTLVDLLIGAGVRRREAEQAAHDVARGGFLIAVRAQPEGIAKAQRALTIFEEPVWPMRERSWGATA